MEIRKISRPVWHCKPLVADFCNDLEQTCVWKTTLRGGGMMRFVAVYGDAEYILFYHGIVQLRFCDSLYGCDRAIEGLWLPKHRYLW